MGGDPQAGRTPSSSPQHSVADLLEHDDHWLEQQGRLTEPMYSPPGRQPLPADPLGGRVPAGRRPADGAGLDPDRAVFYTCGRASNEAAFVYQLLARRLGTNNLPDCSNMCHESSGAALTQTLGRRQGHRHLDDIAYEADLILIVGQNPGTNHPRMLTALEEAKRRGASIVAINPLPEAGLIRFRNPQTVARRRPASAPRWPTATCPCGSTATWRCSPALNKAAA